ncbi:hypothetical protein QUB75_29720, partial [Microcoleus sp. K1-B6]
MDTQEVLNSIDELVFAKTGKHLDTLQVAILKGVLNNRKYAQIAEEYHCSQGHVRDASYELWQMLSTALGADINKSNFRATVERWRIAGGVTRWLRARLNLTYSPHPPLVKI